MENIFGPLQETLKTLYRQALDADQQLDKLGSSAQPKFTAIFSEESGFLTREKRFMPYVEEIIKEWQHLQHYKGDEFPTRLAVLVKKIETMLSTLQAFKQVSLS